MNLIIPIFLNPFDCAPVLSCESKNGGFAQGTADLHQTGFLMGQKFLLPLSTLDANIALNAAITMAMEKNHE